MTTLFVLWILLTIILLLLIGNGKRGGAISITYYLGLSLIHVPGLYVHTSELNGLRNNIETENGFFYTLIGMLTLILGFWLSKFTYQNKKISKNKTHDNLKQSRYLIFIGFIVTFILIPIVAFVPSLTSVVSPLNGLLMIGFWYMFIYAKESKQIKYIWIGLISLPLLPILTMLTGGFMGFGIYWVLTIVSFLYILNKKFKFIIFAPFVAVLGISFSVAYFQQRDGLRESVWQKQSSYNNRFENITKMVDNFEIIDKDNFEHVKYIDDRLNQNVLLGQAITEREAGRTTLALGATVPLWAFIPRAIWKEKPFVGGSNSIVSDYTGRTFASGTSVGVGQPLEFYINFGIPGIIIGYFIFGFILMRIDLNIMFYLNSGNVTGVLRNGLIGIALLQPGGSIMEMLVAVIGTLILTPFVARQIDLAVVIKNIVKKPIDVRNKLLKS